ncbi:nucleotide disphospho-sugar-binding domain-containing protein [Streptomyces sp. NPDC055189]
MRVLFTVYPATAHVHVLVPLAWALRNAGHEVYVALHPDAQELVTHAGLNAVPVGSPDHLWQIIEANKNAEMLGTLDDSLALDLDRADRWEEQWSRLTRILSVYLPVLPDLVDVCRRWQPDLVLWDPFCIPAAVAARVTGAAQARLLWSRDNMGWLFAKSRERRASGTSGLGEEPGRTLLEPMLTAHGLDYDEELLMGQWTIDPSPSGMRLPLDLTYLPMRRIPFNGTASTPAWVYEKPDRPRVCLTLGIGGRGRQLFQESGVSLGSLVEQIARLPVELVVTADAEQQATVGTVPENVRMVDYVPLNTLLPTCSAVIHHGGGGTFAASVAGEVPQCVIPMQFWTEREIGEYVVKRGAGVLLDSGEISAEGVRREVEQLLADPSYQEGARELHREMRDTPSPADVVGSLEELVGQHRAGKS